jgi:hypothetical protein
MTLEIRAYDHGRAESIGRMGWRLHHLLAVLGKVDARFADWHARDEDGFSRLGDAHDCSAAVAKGARTWRSGRDERVAYGVTVVAGREGPPAAEITIVCGVERLAVWIPNQVQIAIDPAIASGRGSGDAAVAEGCLRAVAGAHAPAWAIVRAGGAPTLPVPPFADGAPLVGWMTYLSNDYPQVPALPQPFVSRVEERGTVIVAHPTKPDLESIDRLRELLAEARVLVPAIELRHRH